MTTNELNRFYNQDKQKYKIYDNKDFLNWYNYEIKAGYKPFMNLDSLQDLIDVVSDWYEKNYPDNKLEPKSEQYLFEQLMITLSHEQQCLIKWVTNNKIDLELRNKILRLMSLKLIYSKNTTPENGYKRTKIFISDFNNYLKVNLSTNEIDEIIKNKSKIKRFRENFNKKFYDFMFD